MRALTVDDLRIVDAASFRRAGVHELDALIDVLRRDRVRFLAPSRRAGWDRVAFLNLTFWTAGGGELVPSRTVGADQLAHVAWHHLAARRLGTRTADDVLLAEAIASAFDLYLVGRLLPAAPRSPWLEEQVPRLADRTQDAGLPRAGFARLLARAAARPQAAFESLRQLLYGTARALLPCDTVERAAAVLARCQHPLLPLLHHFELSNWLLHVRAHCTTRPSPRARSLDAALRRSHRPVDELCRQLRLTG